MNCQQFTSLIVEAARGQMSDAAARDGAMRHTETCAACAARLAQEQSLTGALRAVAAGMRDLGAPSRVEAGLLAAFRDMNDSQAKPNASHAESAKPAPVALHLRDESAPRTSARSLPQASRRTTAFVATAIAASLALVALVTLYKQFAQETAPSREATAQQQPAGQDARAERVAAQGGRESSNVATANAELPPSPAVVRSAQQTKYGEPQKMKRDGMQTSVARTGSRHASPENARAAPPRMIASRQVIDGGRAIFAPGESEPATSRAAGGNSGRANEDESVTEFLPLVADAPSATPLEGGQLVRVQLPRAALATLGLPLNAERGNEPVKADVLVGNDGLARAIRFVH